MVFSDVLKVQYATDSGSMGSLNQLGISQIMACYQENYFLGYMGVVFTSFCGLNFSAERTLFAQPPLQGFPNTVGKRCYVGKV